MRSSDEVSLSPMECWLRNGPAAQLAACSQQLAYLVTFEYIAAGKFSSCPLFHFEGFHGPPLFWHPKNTRVYLQ